MDLPVPILISMNQLVRRQLRQARQPSVLFVLLAKCLSHAIKAFVMIFRSILQNIGAIVHLIVRVDSAKSIINHVNQILAEMVRK